MLPAAAVIATDGLPAQGQLTRTSAGVAKPGSRCPIVRLQHRDRRSGDVAGDAVGALEFHPRLRRVEENERSLDAMRSSVVPRPQRAVRRGSACVSILLPIPVIGAAVRCFWSG